MSPISWPVARATARERGLTPITLGLVALLAVLAGFGRPGVGNEAFDGFSAFWFGLLTILMGAGLLSEEVESGHAQMVLLRPLTRAQWVAGRLAGAATVVTFAAVLAWGTSFAAALVRGSGDYGLRVLVLPLALLPLLAWLATLTAVSAVLRGWTNAAWVIAAYAGWKLLKLAVPFRFPGLKPLFESIDSCFGPQEAVMLARQLTQHEPLQLTPLLWDLFWLFACWLAAVRLFNLRELARRRA